MRVRQGVRWRDGGGIAWDRALRGEDWLRQAASALAQRRCATFDRVDVVLQGWIAEKVASSIPLGRGRLQAVPCRLRNGHGNQRGGCMSEIGRAVLVKLTFVLICLGGVAVVWNLPPPLSDVSILIAMAWVVLTSKILKWFVVRIGWSTKDREGGAV